MIKVSWDVEELVALIDIYRRSKGKSYEQIDAELMSLSDTLNKRADRLGEYSAGVVHVNREAWCMLSGKMVQSDRRHGAGRKD